MSPRRRVEPGGQELLRLPDPQPRRWLLPVIATFAGLLLVVAMGASTFVLVKHEVRHQDQLRGVAVRSAVASFMTLYTSPDPFHANEYADKVLAMGTGQFAQLYQAKLNEVVIQVARAEPTTGTVLDVGIERWTDDGSAEVVVAAKTTTKLPDGKVVEDGNRWVVTAKKEGNQWKISNLIQVI